MRAGFPKDFLRNALNRIGVKRHDRAALRSALHRITRRPPIEGRTPDQLAKDILAAKDEALLNQVLTEQAQ